MNFNEQNYPVDGEILTKLFTRRGLTKAGASTAMGYSSNAIYQAVATGRVSRRLAEKLYSFYGITPNDFAPKPAATATRPSPMVDRALLPDGVYTLEIVDVRDARRSSDMVEGRKFVTVTEDHRPFYFTMYDLNTDGTENRVGSAWLQHLLRVVVGDYSREDIPVHEAIGKKFLGYVNIYQKGEKRYNRLLWAEPLEQEAAPELGWPDVINEETDTETLLDVMDCISGELRTRFADAKKG